MNADDKYPIPSRLNAVICLAQLAAVFGCFALAAVGWWPLTLCVAAAFALLMMGVYSTIHEAEHGLLFDDKRLNAVGGVVTAAFFPAPFHLIRQGHVGHHQRNRSDDEAFDLWFPGESPLWKWLQWLGILTGGFYLMVAASNVVVLALPFLLRRKWFKFDRPSAAFMDSLNPRYARVIQLEAVGVIALHVLIVWGIGIPIPHYLTLYAAFGFTWSAMQYVHHYGTERHVIRGARNLRAGWLVDKLWLNHNWHLVHHEHPTVSWLYLEKLGQKRGGKRGFLPWAYLKMWRGPRRATRRVRNRYAGRVVR